MKISDIISMLDTKLVSLSQSRASAEKLGDLERVSALDDEMAQTQVSLDALRSLPSE